MTKLKKKIIMKKMTKLIFDESSSLWVHIEENKYQIELEKINYKKIIKKYINCVGPVVYLSLAISQKVIAEDGFKVYKNSKQIENFFESSNPIQDPKNTCTNEFSKPFPYILILLSLFNNVQTFNQRKIFQKTLELNQLTILEKQKTLNNLLISGGKIALAISLSFYACSIIVLIRLSRSPKFKDKLKEFESKQIFIFLLQLVILISSILFDDLKKIPITLTRLKLREKILFFFSEYSEFLVLSILFGGSLFFLLEYVIFPVLFKKYPELEMFLERYHLRLNTTEINENLKKLQKRIKILETIAIKDKALIKVASTEALLERTYEKKLYSGMKHEMLRLMNELPMKSRNETYKPSYFYKIHQSYRIKQNLLALVYFLIYMNIIQKLEEKIPMLKDDSIKENNSSESF